MRYECDVYATCVVPCYKIVFIFRNICMAIGIDVSIYAKTELLLSPLGVRIVALPYIHAVGTEWLQSPQGARIVALKRRFFMNMLRLQSPQGARIVAGLRDTYGNVI